LQNRTFQRLTNQPIRPLVDKAVQQSDRSFVAWTFQKVLGERLNGRFEFLPPINGAVLGDAYKQALAESIPRVVWVRVKPTFPG
jgi:hypothetical protein